jgi:hypothetical protein
MAGGFGKNRWIAGCRHGERVFIRFEGIMCKADLFVKAFLNFFHIQNRRQETE